MTAQQKIASKIEARKTSDLRAMAKALFTDTRAEASIVLSAVLDVLMARMDDAEFVGFCSEMEGA